MSELTPKRVVQELDRYIIGQADAKKAVAIALRNRMRRQKLPVSLREEITPKNILMIGPTGVGKTELARRMARLVNAPFIKVEATKFTEVGYVGRDVEAIIRDLVETSVRMVKQERTLSVADRVSSAVESRILDALLPAKKNESSVNPFGMLFGINSSGADESPKPDDDENPGARQTLEDQLHKGLLEDALIEIDTEDVSSPVVDMFAGTGAEDLGMNLQEMFGNLLPRRLRHRKVTVAEARRLLTQEEAQKLIDNDEAVAEGIRRAEQAGIVFIDEIDKIAGRESGKGPDVSREGVQRDILPIVEGSTVITKYGPVNSDHMLFIAAGAFHTSKPSDLIPELQGRFPIRVELKSLTKEDFKRILTEPENALIRQYTALLATDGAFVEFADDGIDELAEIACLVNERTENIGARRLHTIVEKVLEDISFEAPFDQSVTIRIDASFVRDKIGSLIKDQDLSRYIL